MNQPEGRPTTGNQPGSSDDPPEHQTPPAPGGPAVEAQADSDSVDAPAPYAQAPPTSLTQAIEATELPRSEAQTTAVTVPTEIEDNVVDDDDDDEAVLDDHFDDDIDDDDFDHEEPSRWAALLATVGTALVGIVSIQVIATVVEGLVLKRGERVGNIPEDLFHRLGYPFGGLGATALVFLVVGVVLLAMPSVLDEYLSPSQDRVIRIALAVSVVMAVIVAIGSLLAVRANLHEYSAKGVAVPGYVRVQFTNFLLGSLGAAALCLFTAIAAMSERGRARTT